MANPSNRRRRWPRLLAGLLSLGLGSVLAATPATAKPALDQTGQIQPARLLVDYFERMCVPRPFALRSGPAFRAYQARQRQRLLALLGLWPLPQRLPLEVRTTEPLQHPWCTVRRVSYQLWPGVYAGGLLYQPKELPEQPAPAMLCPHGHWGLGNAHPIVQARCLMFARLGYVTFSPNQNHYEDLDLGVSHQTLGVWGNMRALDFLESLPEVDRTRLGVCGESGGGLQTQMLLALDGRVRAATIVGMTCDFREILFPHAAHCDCNHFPGVMRLADAPELSALGLPAPVQYLTMNDWTRHFLRDNYSTIARLYACNGVPDRVDAHYEPTEHTYDQSKRERTYWWMEKWLRHRPGPDRPAEPADLRTLAPETLRRLKVPGRSDDQFAAISVEYRKHRGFALPTWRDQTQFATWNHRMAADLRNLLGENAALPRRHTRPAPAILVEDRKLVIEQTAYPSEGGLRLPVVLLRGKRTAGRQPVILLCDAAGKDAALSATGPGSARQLALDGALVVLPDVRFTGEYSPASRSGKLGPELLRFPMASMLPQAADPNQQAAAIQHAWERNAIVWGRPLAGMACTDLRAVLDGALRRPEARRSSVLVLSRGAGGLAMAALYAAALDKRITALDADLCGACYANGKLPPLPFVLWHGDVLQWTALLADRKVTLRNLPPEAGDPAWLAQAFALRNNAQGLACVRDCP
jgi:dienelactone hydrolase